RTDTVFTVSFTPPRRSTSPATNTGTNTFPASATSSCRCRTRETGRGRETASARHMARRSRSSFCSFPINSFLSINAEFKVVSRSSTRGAPRMDQAHDADLAGLARLKEAHQKLRQEIARVVVGQDAVVEQLMMAIFSRGHCILEGVPGLAKTLMVSTLAE